jgi:hypothetical protein
MKDAIHNTKRAPLVLVSKPNENRYKLWVFSYIDNNGETAQIVGKTLVDVFDLKWRLDNPRLERNREAY